MINITDAAAFARALDSPLDPNLKRLLLLRRDQLLTDTGGEYELGDLVQFIIAENDSVAAIEAAANYPIITEPAFEWVAHHGTHYESVTILSDDGFGIALFAADRQGVDPTLLAVLRAHVTQDAPIAADQGQQPLPTVP
ncbi:MAG: hypothetical protein EON59_00980 [Alphaproteobacteria bacterium]|nr:MAG: hypothetical protein EON59_00980 [Alphaproteobacteria bacterium]